MNRQKNISGTDLSCGARRIRRVAAQVVPLIFLSFFLGAFTVAVANDMYAFIKPDTASSITFEADTPLLSVAKTLENEGIINNPVIFSLYVKTKGAEPRLRRFSGEVRLSASMSYREIIASFS